MNEKFLENDAAKKIQINNNKEEESKISSTSIIENEFPHSSPKNLPTFNFIENKIQKQIVFESGEYKILSIRFDPLDNFIALGCEDGHVRIFQKEKEQCLINLFENMPAISPATCVRWKPFTQSTKNILITGHTDGSLHHWHATSKKIIHSLSEVNNHIYALDFMPGGEMFATGGRDGDIRLYNEAKMSKFQILQEGNNVPKHKNRIYAIKFLNDNPNLLISAGWDKTVLLWDIRTCQSENYLYGPMICGDSLDYKNGTILTGSWRNEDQLELWDLKMMKRIGVIAWEEFEENIRNKSKSYIYTCQFQKAKGNYIIAGSTGNNEIRLFDINKEFKCVDGVKNLEQGVFSLDWANEKENIFSYAGSNGLCGLIVL